MLEKINPEALLFLDIETVPEVESFEKLPEKKQLLWEKKSAYFRDEETPADVYPRAGIYAEFGKIICISVGMTYVKDGNRFIRLHSFFGEDEKLLLTDFIALLNKLQKKPDLNLCAHNGKEFDFPYLARRTLINGLPLPGLLNVAGKKPWEVPFLDTLELWKFGDYKHYTSLELLADIFNIPTPKDDIDGSQVYDVYWKEHDLPRIVKYCEKDVLTVAQLFLRFRGQPLIEEKNIEFSGSGTDKSG